VRCGRPARPQPKPRPGYRSAPCSPLKARPPAEHAPRAQARRSPATSAESICLAVYQLWRSFRFTERRHCCAETATASAEGRPNTARELAGRALAQAGDRDRAALELELAAEAFDSFGSLRYRNRAERELRKLGWHIHRRTRAGTNDGSGSESLTERELQVVRLVVDRKTNPQIAAELFLSQKTVETHLRNIFHKMGVTTRAALARAVERTDPTASSRPR
jgi:DNA-binding CsgD family transcriptional regulator